MQCGLYQPRLYRAQCQAENLKTSRVCIDESDLLIFAARDMYDPAYWYVQQLRDQLTGYISDNPEFAASLQPLPVADHAPEIVQYMVRAGYCAGVGPMAAVAGAISEYTARFLHKHKQDIIIENGGDIYAFYQKPLSIALFAGASPLSMKIGLTITTCLDGMGICTSSGSVGHSLSFGNADAVTVIAKNGALADAVATALANRVQGVGDIDTTLKYGARVSGVLGIVIIIREHIGMIGECFKLCSL